MRKGLEIALKYPLIRAILNRRSRRFGLGMKMEGLLAFKSKKEPIPLSEEEEALLVWAGAGLTGSALLDLPIETGLESIVQWTGRTYPSPCNEHATELFYTNDEGVYFVKVRDCIPEKLAIFEDIEDEELVDTILRYFRKCVIKLEDSRAELPDKPPGLFAFNVWNANKPGTSLFFPVTDTTIWYIDLIMLYSAMKIPIYDEKNDRWCGVEEWIKSGALKPEYKMSLYEFEKRLITGLMVEQAVITHNMSLMAQAMGLGGWVFTGFLPFYALGGSPEYKGFGFRFVKSKAGQLVPVGRDGVFEAYCPPYYSSMEKAVDAWLKDREKFWREAYVPYRDEHLKERAKQYSEKEILICKDVCNYIYETYGRIPAYIESMFSRLQAQFQHIDIEFYDTYYKKGAYSETHLHHLKLWHEIK
ncbi:MAG: hypothetical protein QXN49_07240 [Archaeoglobaceae archaeon]